jgi:hypothetical protein
VLNVELLNEDQDVFEREQPEDKRICVWEGDNGVLPKCGTYLPHFMAPYSRR